MTNRLTADQLAALTPNAIVAIEVHKPGASTRTFTAGLVTKVTATRITVSRRARSGAEDIERYRRRDGSRLGDSDYGQSAALVDPDHPETVRGIAEQKARTARDRIDSLHRQWMRTPEDAELLTRLRMALDDYATTHAAPPRPSGNSTAIYPGSRKSRQEVGKPGHCEDCATKGHVIAHPDLGCSDVGCYASH